MPSSPKSIKARRELIDSIATAFRMAGIGSHAVGAAESIALDIEALIDLLIEERTGA